MADLVARLTDDSFRTLAARVFARIDSLMSQMACDGDMFTGWDWPTAGVYHPRRVAMWRRILAEANRRGVTSFPDTRNRRVRRRTRIHRRCDHCELLRINGMVCHETGCPNARKQR